MPDLSNLSLIEAAGLFVAAAAVITFIGQRIARTADRLADVTGLGEAFFGGVLLGSSTSIPGIVTSVSAAADNHPELAFSNAVGGIAAQTFFLAIADLTYRRANLEHAAASVANMMQGALLIILLSVVLLLISAATVTLGPVDPGSVVLVLAYLFGLRIIRRAEGGSTWTAMPTRETVVDRPDRRREPAARRRRLWMSFAVFAVVLAGAGHVVAQTGVAIARGTGLSETVVGAFFTAVATSMPELVTSVAAVRAGALTLAVGNIIGGNTFDVLFVAFADFAYREGSIYQAQSDRQVFVISLAILLTAILLLGLLRREKYGIANIGFESLWIMLMYLGGFAFLFFVGAPS